MVIIKFWIKLENFINKINLFCWAGSFIIKVVPFSGVDSTDKTPLWFSVIIKYETDTQNALVQLRPIQWELAESK